MRFWKKHPIPGKKNYANWIGVFDNLSLEQKKQLWDNLKARGSTPLISIGVVHGSSNSVWQLGRTLQSVHRQTYRIWECVFLAHSNQPSFAVRLLLKLWTWIDPRIRVCSESVAGDINISRTLNAGISNCNGAWVGFLQSGDLLSESALLWVAREIEKTPNLQLIYGDEDCLDEGGERINPLFKSDWNPEFFLTHFYMGSLIFFRKGIMRLVGGFMETYPQAELYDLACRVIEQVNEKAIGHVPRILSHHIQDTGGNERYFLLKNNCPPGNQGVIKAHLSRIGKEANVTQDAQNTKNRIRFALPKPLPLVSILIPIRDKVELLIACINSIRQNTSYPNLEIIVIDNGSIEQTTLQYLQTLKSEGVEVACHDSPFNFSALINCGASNAQGTFLCMLNNDIEILTPDWLEEMLSFAIQPEIGCVGAKLWYPDGRLQHGGVVLGINGVAGHAFKFSHHQEKGYADRLEAPQAIGAVTGACLLIEKAKFDAVDGMDESLAVAFNDIDLCLKMAQHGWRNVWTPYAQMIHHESVSRGYEDNPEKLARFHSEIARMQAKWSTQLASDPYYNPNLTKETENFSLNWRSKH